MPVKGEDLLPQMLEATFEEAVKQFGAFHEDHMEEVLSHLGTAHWAMMRHHLVGKKTAEAIFSPYDLDDNGGPVQLLPSLHPLTVEDIDMCFEAGYSRIPVRA